MRHTTERLIRRPTPDTTGVRVERASGGAGLRALRSVVRARDGPAAVGPAPARVGGCGAMDAAVPSTAWRPATLYMDI